jgi:hypothetical protein
VVQDPPAPPSDTLLLPPLTSLYSANARNRELPQQGESRPVLPPTQRSLSRQIMKAWAPWTEVIAFSQNSRMLEQLTLRTPLTIDASKEQHLDSRPCSNIEHPSVLAHEMMAIESGEKPSRKLIWKPTAWISHIVRRSHDDRLPMLVWEAWFCSTLGVPIPALVENPGPCACQHFDIYGDHHKVITSRPVNYNLQRCTRMSGLFTGSASCFVLLVTV